MKMKAFLKKSICLLFAAALCISAGMRDADADDKATFRIKCQTADGSELASYTGTAAHAGTEVTIKPPKIDGFQAVTESYTCMLAKSGQVLVITYRRTGGTDIGSAYGTTYNGQEVETIPEEKVPLSASEVKGYRILAAGDKGTAVLFSSRGAAVERTTVLILTAAAVCFFILFLRGRIKNRNALQHIFADCSRDDRQ